MRLSTLDFVCSSLKMSFLFPEKNSENTPPVIDPLHDLQDGYPKLAGRMGIQPEMAMFKRFGALNARNLLYMQSELMNLERCLKRAEMEDAMARQGDKPNYSRDFYWLRYSELVGPDTRQLNLIKRIRDVLKEYSTLSYMLQVCIVLTCKKIRP